MIRQRRFMFFAGALLIFCNYALSYAGTLPATGQRKCYNAKGNVIACAGTGQDGAHIVQPKSYTDNGDGTVTDNVTGLMWQKQDAGNKRTWVEAGAYCTNLSIGEHTDWRLPTKKKLMSLVDYGIPYPGPTINPTYFPNAHASAYWSSTAGADHAGYAWVVYFDDGYVGYAGKSINGYVRCVRGGK